MSGSKFYYGTNHVFTSREASENPVVFIQPGKDETLIIKNAQLEESTITQPYTEWVNDSAGITIPNQTLYVPKKGDYARSIVRGFDEMTTDGVIVIPSDGIYTISQRVEYAGGPIGTKNLSCSIDNATNTTFSVAYVNQAGRNSPMALSSTLFLEAGAEVSLITNQITLGDLTIDKLFFSIAKVSD